MTLTWHHRPDDHQHPIMTDHISTTPSTISNIQTSDVRFVRSSSSSLRTLNTLDEDGLIVLFTPALPLASGRTRENAAEDPFECLGRAISRRHSRVRHVPFVARVGLTDLHLAWMRRASAIIVTNCDPSLLADTKDNGNMSSQIKFGLDVSEALKSMHDDKRIPLSFVCISRSAAPPHRSYENLLVCSSYSGANMERVASMLMH